MPKLRLFVSAIAIIVFTICGLSQDSFAQKRETYTVKSGDTLFSISKKLDVSIAELKEWNELNDNSINVGQELVYYVQGELEEVIPDALEEGSPFADPGESLMNVEPTQRNVVYTVKSGDSLYKIANEAGMSIAALKELNGISSDVISIGQRLIVRAATSIIPSVSEFSDESTPQGKYVAYTIKAGELLSDLLEKFKMTEEEFKYLNSEIDIRRLARGQVVTVLLPPSKTYANPYLSKSNLEDLGLVAVSRYEEGERGNTTINGELYNPDELTAAHANIALGTLLFIENPENGRGTYVRINDRTATDGLKLSSKAFELLAFRTNAQPSVTLFLEN